MDPDGCIYMFVYKYKYMCIAIIIKGKEAVNLKVGGRYKKCQREATWEELEGRKGIGDVT